MSVREPRYLARCECGLCASGALDELRADGWTGELEYTPNGRCPKCSAMAAAMRARGMEGSFVHEEYKRAVAIPHVFRDKPWVSLVCECGQTHSEPKWNDFAGSGWTMFADDSEVNGRCPACNEKKAKPPHKFSELTALMHEIYEDQVKAHVPSYPRYEDPPMVTLVCDCGTILTMPPQHTAKGWKRIHNPGLLPNGINASCPACVAKAKRSPPHTATHAKAAYDELMGQQPRLSDLNAMMNKVCIKMLEDYRERLAKEPVGLMAITDECGSFDRIAGAPYRAAYPALRVSNPVRGVIAGITAAPPQTAVEWLFAKVDSIRERA